MTETRQLLTAIQVAEMIGKSARTVQRMAETGDLRPEAKLHGRTGAYVFAPDVVEAWLEQRRGEATVRTGR